MLYFYLIYHKTQIIAKLSFVHKTATF